jgi:hypothetical protein
VSLITLTSSRAESLDFWRTFCPELGIEANRPRPSLELGDVTQLMSNLRVEGYVNVPNVLPEPVFCTLRDCVAKLFDQKIPLAFAFVYDEFWTAFQGVSKFLEAALGPGYRALPDFWVWHVPAAEDATGWGPHRDRVQPTLERDNTPHSLTVWLAFTDATPLNGCIYMLPAHLDECFKRRKWDGTDNTLVSQPQDIRALPASAGSMLAWNQAVLHWGGRASSLAPGPRASAAFEFQRGDKPPFNQPLLDPLRVPPFHERLGLIGKQVLQYQHMYPLSAEVQLVAESLRDKYMPGRAAIQWAGGGGGGGGGGSGGGGGR